MEIGDLIILHIEGVITTSGQVREIDHLTGFAGDGVEHCFGCLSAPYGITGYIQNIAIGDWRLEIGEKDRCCFLLMRRKAYLVQTDRTVVGVEMAATDKECTKGQSTKYKCR